MKKSFPVLAAIIMAQLLVSSGTGEEPKRVMNFLAVMDLNCGTAINKENCTALTNVLIDELVKTKKYTVIDRANRDKILAEQGFQQTGCADEHCTVEAGRLLGVGKIVVGSISKIGQTYLLSLQLINVETAAVDASASEECKCDIDGLIGSIRTATRKLMGEDSVSTPSTTPISPSAPPSSYPSIFDAIRSGDLNAVKYFLDTNPGVLNAKDPKTGYPPLTLALVSGRSEIFRFLIERGADVNAKGGKGAASGLTALHYALMGCDYADVFPAVELLINKGADVNASGGVLGKPLKLAKKCGDKRIYDLLKQHGAT